MITVVRRHAVASRARLTWLGCGLRIEWGNRKCMNFQPAVIEVLMFSEYPELKDLHDGIGRNLDDLPRLLKELKGTALPEAVTVLLTQKDINLWSAAGFSLAY